MRCGDIREDKFVEQLSRELPHPGCGQLLLDWLDRTTRSPSPVPQQPPPESKPRESKDLPRTLNAESFRMWGGELPADGKGLPMPVDVGSFDCASRLAELRPATRETHATTGRPDVLMSLTGDRAQSTPCRNTPASSATTPRGDSNSAPSL